MLSEKQKKFIYESTAKINIAHGSVRSGKTHSSLIRFVELVDRCPDSKIIIIGNSFGAIKENVVKFLKDDLLRGYCVWKGNKLIVGDKEIRVIGAHDEGSVRAIQGNTHSLAYVDELTTIPYNFVDMLTTRLSHDWSKMIATCNPSSPVHPVKENLIDCGDPGYCYALHFDIDDNPALSEQSKADLRTKYTGLFYKRYILGEWVAAEGSVYADFSRKTHVLPRAPHFADNYFVGIDYGIHNAFACVLIGQNNTHSPHLWVEKEFYWDSKKTYRAKLNSELADDVERFLEGYNVRGIYLDPSASSFEVELKRRQIRVLQAENDVYAGITFVANLISNHELKVVSCCENLIGEIEQYVWDAKRAERGDEQPVKKNDHACFAGWVCVDGKRISKRKVGDLIRTRNGKKRITYIVGRTAECFYFDIAGKSIACTEDHPFLTVDDGWKKASDLLQSDILITHQPCIKWTKKDFPFSSISMGKDTDDILFLKTCLTQPILNAEENTFIEIFGSTLEDPYRKDFIYITSTETPLTMIYPILNAYLQKSMQADIHKIVTEAFRVMLKRHVHFGTGRMLGECGTGRTPLSPDSGETSRLNTHVNSAESLFFRPSEAVQDFVRINVSLPGAGRLQLTMSLENAFFVQRDFSLIDIESQNIALSPVPRSGIGKKKVFNLSVEDDEEYFADGILVHNCDALRYALFTAFGKKKSLTWGVQERSGDGGSGGNGPQGVQRFKPMSDYGFR